MPGPQCVTSSGVRLPTASRGRDGCADWTRDRRYAACSRRNPTSGGVRPPRHRLFADTQPSRNIALFSLSEQRRVPVRCHPSPVAFAGASLARQRPPFTRNTAGIYSTSPYSMDFRSTPPVTRSEAAPPPRSQADNLRIQTRRPRRHPARRRWLARPVAAGGSVCGCRSCSRGGGSGDVAAGHRVAPDRADRSGGGAGRTATTAGSPTVPGHRNPGVRRARCPPPTHRRSSDWGPRPWIGRGHRARLRHRPSRLTPTGRVRALGGLSTLRPRRRSPSNEGAVGEGWATPSRRPIGERKPPRRPSQDIETRGSSRGFDRSCTFGSSIVAELSGDQGIFLPTGFA